MKFPKSRMRYCPHCKKHTEHKVADAKKKTVSSAHPLSHGGKIRAARRGRMAHGNRGRYSRAALSKWKMTGKKTSKKVDLRYQCTMCKKSITQAKGTRTRKVEFV